MEKISKDRNPGNESWIEKVKEINDNPDYISSPRGMEVKEIVPGQIRLPMPAFNDLASRSINEAFMYAEAAAIISGSNKLSDFNKYMKSYSRYSDDGQFMRGSYGPKIVDQLGSAVDALEEDMDTRQSYINIWRERPGKSLDIPCTTGMQFIVRDQEQQDEDENLLPRLHMVATMRSNDIVLGTTYDQFTFSMVAKSVQLLLKARGIEVELGDLTINAGSMHIYSNHYQEVEKWTNNELRNRNIFERVKTLDAVKTYEELIQKLGYLAWLASEEKKDNSY